MHHDAAACSHSLAIFENSEALPVLVIEASWGNNIEEPVAALELTTVCSGQVRGRH